MPQTNQETCDPCCHDHAHEPWLDVIPRTKRLAFSKVEALRLRFITNLDDNADNPKIRYCTYPPNKKQYLFFDIVDWIKIRVEAVALLEKAHVLHIAWCVTKFQATFIVK